MEQGLRVVGTVEFGGLDNPISKSRVKNLINNRIKDCDTSYT